MCDVAQMCCCSRMFNLRMFWLKHIFGSFAFLGSSSPAQTMLPFLWVIIVWCGWLWRHSVRASSWLSLGNRCCICIGLRMLTQLTNELGFGCGLGGLLVCDWCASGSCVGSHADLVEMMISCCTLEPLQRCEFY